MFEDGELDDLFNDIDQAEESIEALEQKAEEVTGGVDQQMLQQFTNTMVIFMLKKMAEEEEDPQEFLQNVLDQWKKGMKEKFEAEMEEFQQLSGGNPFLEKVMDGLSEGGSFKEEWQQKMDSTTEAIADSLGLNEDEEEEQQQESGDEEE